MKEINEKNINDLSKDVAGRKIISISIREYSNDSYLIIELSDRKLSFRYDYIYGFDILQNNIEEKAMSNLNDLNHHPLSQQFKGLKEKADFYEEQAKNLLPEIWVRFCESALQSEYGANTIPYVADSLLEAFKERFIK